MESLEWYENNKHKINDDEAVPANEVMDLLIKFYVMELKYLNSLNQNISVI